MRKRWYVLISNPQNYFKPPTVTFFSHIKKLENPRHVRDTLSIKSCYNKIQMKPYLYGCLYHVFVSWRVTWHWDVNGWVSSAVSGQIVFLMKLELKIMKQFVIHDNTIALPAVCGKNMQRKYQEMHLIFTPGIGQPQGIYSCNFFYWSARVCRDLIFKTMKFWVVFFNYDSPSQD